MPFIPPYVIPGVVVSIEGDIQASGPLVGTRPPFIPAANCAQVLIRCKFDEEPGETVLYFHDSAGFNTITTMQSLLNDVHDAWVTNMMPYLATSVELYEIHGTALDTATSVSYTRPVDPTVLGATLGETAPANLAIGIATHTGFRGRSNNGRVFLSGQLDSAFVLGFPAEIDRGDMLTQFGAFITALNGLGYTYVLVSYQSQKKWRTLAQVTTIAALTVGKYIYTMRRRLPGHNRHR